MAHIGKNFKKASAEVDRNKRYKLAGQDKLRVEADLPEMAERVERVKQLFAELAAPPEPVKSKR